MAIKATPRQVGRSALMGKGRLSIGRQARTKGIFLTRKACGSIIIKVKASRGVARYVMTPGPTRVDHQRRDGVQEGPAAAARQGRAREKRCESNGATTGPV